MEGGILHITPRYCAWCKGWNGTSAVTADKQEGRGASEMKKTAQRTFIQLYHDQTAADCSLLCASRLKKQAVAWNFFFFKSFAKQIPPINGQNGCWLWVLSLRPPCQTSAASAHHHLTWKIQPLRHKSEFFLSPWHQCSTSNSCEEKTCWGITTLMFLLLKSIF